MEHLKTFAITEMVILNDRSARTPRKDGGEKNADQDLNSLESQFLRYFDEGGTRATGSIGASPGRSHAGR